jgi:ribosomal protein S11
VQQPFAAMGPRKVDPSVIGGSKGPRAKREGVVHVNSTFNNTHLVLTDRDSKVETWVSGGTVGYKNANKVGGLRVGHPHSTQCCSSMIAVPGEHTHGPRQTGAGRMTPNQ